MYGIAWIKTVCVDVKYCVILSQYEKMKVFIYFILLLYVYSELPTQPISVFFVSLLTTSSSCPLNNSSHSLSVNTTDPYSHVSVLLGHQSHAGNPSIYLFLVSEVFSLVGGSRSGVDIKIHKGVLYIGKHVRSRGRR